MEPSGRLIAHVNTNFAYVNSTSQREPARFHNSWVLHVAWGECSQIPAGHAEFGDPTQARDAIEALARQFRWGGSSLRSLVDAALAANLVPRKGHDGSIIVAQRSGAEILTINSDGSGEIHEPSLGAAAICVAIATLTGDAGKNPLPRLDRFLDL